MQQRIVICAGGSLGAWAAEHIGQDDMLIGADSGAAFLLSIGKTPDIAIGDFDSVTEEELRLIKEHSRQFFGFDAIDKDYTDTELAFRRALELEPSEIVLIGAIGSRFDHSLANLHLLALALESGIPARIVDANNQIRLIDSETAIGKGPYSHISLLPLSEQVTGITLTGFQYPLNEATIAIGQSIGISNVLLKEQGVIQIREGKLLVIQSRD